MSSVRGTPSRTELVGHDSGKLDGRDTSRMRYRMEPLYELLGASGIRMIPTDFLVVIPLRWG